MQGRRRISIKDIARAAGLAPSTVSRALAFSPLIPMATATRVRDIAATMGYRASAVARSLVSGKTKTIGVVVTDIADPFHADVLAGIEETARQQGYSVLLAASRSDPDRELKVVCLLEGQRVDAIIVASSQAGTRYAAILDAFQAPVVFVNNHEPVDPALAVSIDDEGGARLAAAHLTRLGHRHIAYIGNAAGRQPQLDRLAGYQTVMGATGIPPVLQAGDGSPEGGLRAMNALLAGGAVPTAVFCYDDLTAIGALRAIQASGLRVPADISVVGFDDVSLASYLNPPLTTVRQPAYAMGARAFELALGGDGQTDGTVRFQGELIVRESTAAPRQSSSLSAAR